VLSNVIRHEKVEHGSVDFVFPSRKSRFRRALLLSKRADA
jgi:hypothetical protein